MDKIRSLLAKAKGKKSYDAIASDVGLSKQAVYNAIAKASGQTGLFLAIIDSLGLEIREKDEAPPVAEDLMNLCAVRRARHTAQYEEGKADGYIGEEDYIAFGKAQAYAEIYLLIKKSYK
jgi:hypothetical protein